MRRYEPSEIEPKWQAVWERDQVFRAVEGDDRHPAPAGFVVVRQQQQLLGERNGRHSR